MIKIFLISCLLFLIQSKSFSQTNISVDTLNFEGKWAVCTEVKFSQDFKCDKGYITYELFPNGTFKDPRPSFDGDGDHEFSLGTWSLKDDKFIIDYYDTENSMTPPMVYKIKFLTKDKFYSIGQEGEGGVTVYTFFQKIVNKQ